MTALAAWVGLIATGWLVVFQLALALGAPLGHMAWGGAKGSRLPPRLRWASFGVALLVGGLFAAYGQRAGLWALFPDRSLFMIFGFTSILFGISFLGNLASSSRAERLHGVPLTLVIAGSAAYLAFD